MNRGRTSLFSSGVECAHLLAPLPFAGLAIGEILLHPEWRPAELAWIRFVANILLFNSVHVVLSFVLVMGMPALREWVGRRYGISPGRWALRTLGFAILFAAVFFAGGAYFRVVPEWRRAFTALLIGLGLSVPHFHSLWQIRGLSLLYGQKDRGAGDLNEAARLRVQKAESRERLLLRVFLFSFIGVQIAYLAAELPPELPFWSATLAPLKAWAHFAELRLVLVFVNSALALAIVAGAATMPGAARSGRSLYLLRLFLYPLSGYSLLAFAGLSAMHGLEYVAVFLHLTSKTEAHDRRRIRRFGLTMMFAIVPFFLPAYLTIWGLANPSLALQILSAFGIATVYVHYLVDRALFRMRDTATRELVGPLLL